MLQRGQVKGARRRKTETDGMIAVSKTVKFIESKAGMLVTRGWGKG